MDILLQQIAFQRISNLILNKSAHIDYARVTGLADKYRKVITGVGIETMLLQFVQREDKEMFEQRCRLTKSITGAVCSAIKRPFNKVTRNKKVRAVIGIQDEAKVANIQAMQSGFFGGTKRGNKGLNGFLNSRFLDLTFTDPNAWVVVEWGAVSATQIPQPKPYIASAAQALDFGYKGEELDYLLVKLPIKYKSGERTYDGDKYIMYGVGYTVVFKQVGKEYTPQGGEQVAELAGKYYAGVIYETKLTYVPAYRVGYERDLSTEGRTYVNPFDVAMPYLEKLIERVSELDLTMRLHVFPQKLQYVQKCAGASREKKCMSGKLVDGTECGSCKGTGYKVHTTAQDILLLPMPSSKEEMLDLDKLITYKSPPSDIITIQREYVKDLKADAMQAVFNSDVFVTGKVAKTATEKNIDMDSVYDTLAPFAQKYSELWVALTAVMVDLIALDSKVVPITHVFPSDLKLKTVPMLLAELEVANSSNAPSYVRDTINTDIAEAMYADDEMELHKFKVKRRFYPFNGKTPDEVALATASEFVPKFDKVLYFNFEKIFAELERDVPKFYVLPFEKQWKAIGEKVNTLIDDLSAGSADRFAIGSLTGIGKTSAGAQGGTGAGDNGGNAQ